MFALDLINLWLTRTNGNFTRLIWWQLLCVYNHQHHHQAPSIARILSGRGSEMQHNTTPHSTYPTTTCPALPIDLLGFVALFFFLSIQNEKIKLKKKEGQSLLPSSISFLLLAVLPALRQSPLCLTCITKYISSISQIMHNI